MLEAGPITLLRTLLILVLIYYGFKILARIFAPILMKKMAKKMEERAERFKNQRYSQSPVKEGETVIDKKPTRASESKNTVGDYIDFEEID